MSERDSILYSSLVKIVHQNAGYIVHKALHLIRICHEPEFTSFHQLNFSPFDQRVKGACEQCLWRNLIDCANRGFATFRQHFAHSSNFGRPAKCDCYRGEETFTGRFVRKVLTCCCFNGYFSAIQFSLLYCSSLTIEIQPHLAFNREGFGWPGSFPDHSRVYNCAISPIAPY
jgi:hypothetical protein